MNKQEQSTMLTYTMDVEDGSIWQRTTPSQAALSQPYVVTEAGLFYGREKFSTSRGNKESYLIFYTIEGCGQISQGGDTILLNKGEALLLNCRSPQNYGTYKAAGKWHHYWIHADGPGVKAMEPYLIPDGKYTFQDQQEIYLKVCWENSLKKLQNPLFQAACMYIESLTEWSEVFFQKILSMAMTIRKQWKLSLNI